MRRRPTTSPTSPLRTWSRRLPSLAAAAILALGTSRAGAEQAQLGTPMPMGTYLPPAGPSAPTPVPTTLPALPNPGGSQLQPSSLQSRQAAAATPKVADQRPIQTSRSSRPAAQPQPTMAELRQSLRDEGLKNMGMPEFTRQIGAKPPTPPAGMLPAKTTSSWPTLLRADAGRRDGDGDGDDSVDGGAPLVHGKRAGAASSQPVVQQTSNTAPAPEQPATPPSVWSRWFSRTPDTATPPTTTPKTYSLPPSYTESAPRRGTRRRSSSRRAGRHRRRNSRVGGIA